MEDKKTHIAERIAARWRYMDLWAKAMTFWYGPPPSYPDWTIYAFYCYYGKENKMLWPDRHEKQSGTGPKAGMIQICSLALIEGPIILLKLTERRAQFKYGQVVEIS